MRRLVGFTLVGAIALSGVVSAVAVSSAIWKSAQSVDGVTSLVDRIVDPPPARILPDPVTVVHELKATARLETANAKLQKVVRTTRNPEMLFGAFSESMLFVGNGEVTAGIDLEKMEATDVQIGADGRVYVRIPAAEILSVRLDNDQSYVANRDWGWLASTDTELETRVRRAVETELRAGALEMGLLDKAEENAERWMATFLGNLGFEDVRVISGPCEVDCEFN